MQPTSRQSSTKKQSRQKRTEPSIPSEPLFFETYLRERIWGGDGLSRYFGKKHSDHAPIGEAWDLSSLPQHVSQIASGSHCGELLTSLWTKWGKEISGGGCSDEEFPWLVKWLDCTGSLSLQVHPGSELADNEFGLNHRKSEIWVVVHAYSGARVSCGIRNGVSRENFEHHLRVGTIEQCLHTFEPRIGDCISLPAGTVHTASGIIIAEIQQPCDVTYRLFDWNRSDGAGQKRPLHVNQGLKAIDWCQGSIDPVSSKPLLLQDHGVRGEVLIVAPWVRLERYTLERMWVPPRVGEMTVWMVLDGEVELYAPECQIRRELSGGSTVLIPATVNDIVWSPLCANSSCTLLCVHKSKL